MKKRTHNEGQLSLTGLIELPEAPKFTEGSLDYDAELRATLSKALKETKLSRYEVAARMSELTGTEITKAQIDSWTAESREGWRFPFAYAAAFEAALQTPCLAELHSRKMGYKVYVDGADIVDAEIGRLDAAIADMTAKSKELKKMRSAARK